LISPLGDRIYVQAPELTLILNNSSINVAPPADEDLKSLAPANILFSIDSAVLSSAVSFFTTFYKSSDKRVLTIHIKNDGVLLIIKDSGVAGFSSAHVEKFLDTGTILGDGEEDFEFAVHQDDLDEFLNIVIKASGKNPPPMVDVYVDNDDDHRAMKLSTVGRSVYLAKKN
jgi:hypothetical protein